MTFEGLELGHYAAIAADPAWQWKAWSKKGEGRSARRHYELMSVEAIIALPVAELAARDCALFLWATGPMLPSALQVMQAWGFKYKTIVFSWTKTTTRTDGTWAPKYHMALGYWSRANVEICLLGTRGKPRRTAKDVRQLIVAPRREHSRKPEQFFASVERLVPGPYLELFSREARPGWSAWGNESSKFNEGSHVDSDHSRGGLHSGSSRRHPALSGVPEGETSGAPLLGSDGL